MALKIIETITNPFYGPSLPPVEEPKSKAEETADKVANLPGPLEVAVDYVQEAEGLRQMVLEPVAYSMQWAEIAFSALGDILAKPQAAVEGISHVLLWIDLPTQLLKLYKSVVQLGESILDGKVLKTADKAAKVYVNGSYMIGLVSDAVMLLYREGHIVLSTGALAAVQILGLVGNVALIVSAIRGIKKQILILKEAEPWTPRFNLALIQLSAKVCLAVVAIFSIAAFFSTAVYFPWMILAFSTILFFLTLIAHFYQKTHIPDKVKVEKPELI